MVTGWVLIACLGDSPCFSWLQPQPSVGKGSQELFEVIIFPLHLSLIFQLLFLDQGFVNAQCITTPVTLKCHNVYWMCIVKLQWIYLSYIFCLLYEDKFVVPTKPYQYSFISERRQPISFTPIYPNLTIDLHVMQNRYGPLPEFPLALPYSDIVHHLLGCKAYLQ